MTIATCGRLQGFGVFFARLFPPVRHYAPASVFIRHLVFHPNQIPAMKTPLLLLAASAVLALFSPVRADSPFDVTVTSGSSTVTEGYSSFPSLLSDVLNANGSFVGFANSNFNAKVTFLGVPDAVRANS